MEKPRQASLPSENKNTIWPVLSSAALQLSKADDEEGQAIWDALEMSSKSRARCATETGASLKDADGVGDRVMSSSVAAHERISWVRTELDMTLSQTPSASLSE